MEFREALRLQERLVCSIAAGTDPETLVLLEHHPVYTIGMGGNSANHLAPDGEPVRINRGGDITWHGHGQLVGYPLINLGRRGKDLHRWLRLLEDLLIATVQEFGVAAWRVPGMTGVWTEGGKVAFIGVGVRRWTTMHGFALNVSPDLSSFTRINPCGIPGCPVTSLLRERGVAPSLPEVKNAVATLFPRILGEQLPLMVPPGRA